MNTILWMTPSAALATLLSACAAVQAPLPPQLTPPAGHVPSGSVAARGVQIYECKADTAPGSGATHAWTFVAPEAELHDAQGRPAGTHGAGPFWQAADGSRIVGSVKARADAPRPGAIPWLLLEARSTGGPGTLAGVRSVQRVNTRGGAAPAQPCSANTTGQVARVDYTADYHYFSPR